ncbi:scavenger receptor class F member 1-like [Haliotis rufescens]|uniref:scavenger receptor class F member 1-like n=1 Tax=Haliotis rufescens TaxID=6454 RepID=UPI00201F08EB|nr:scavenger receptor class F member 1-like [Haliotis rufescens]
MATPSAVIAVAAHIIVLTHACRDPTNCIKLNHVDTTGKPTCELGCIDGWSGDCCRQHCLDRCMACSSRNKRECTKCESGRYGIRCEDLCGQCHKGNCSINGTCHDGCKPGFWGTRCSNPCSQHCKDEEMDSPCEHHTGHCIYGCKGGYFGESCDAMCPDDCEGCNSTHRDCQVCRGGRCSTQCNDGFYGIECNQSCLQNCKQCLNSNTTCKTCSDKDGMCSIGCIHGFYGPTCNQTCPQNCKDCNESDVGCLKCGREDGECSQGCREGYYGRHCQITCPENCLQCNTTRDCDDCMVSHRGSNCTLLCHTCPSVRQYINCTVKCKDGIDGEMNDITTHKASSKDNEDFFGTISDLINEKEYLLPFLASALVLCIGLSAFILWRCKKTRRERLSAMDNGCLEVKTSEEEVFQKCGDIYHEIHDEDLDTNMSLIPAGQRPLPDRPRLPIPLEAVTSAVDHACSLPETGASGHSSVGYLTPQQTQDVEQPRYTSSRTDDGVYLDVRQSHKPELVGETSFTVPTGEVGRRHLAQRHSRRDIRTRKCGTKQLSLDSGTCFVTNEDPETTKKDKAGNRLFKVRAPVCKRTMLNPRGSCEF